MQLCTGLRLISFTRHLDLYLPNSNCILKHVYEHFCPRYSSPGRGYDRERQRRSVRSLPSAKRNTCLSSGFKLLCLQVDCLGGCKPGPEPKVAIM
jgi:hypothetical protein